MRTQDTAPVMLTDEIDMLSLARGAVMVQLPQQSKLHLAVWPGIMRL